MPVDLSKVGIEGLESFSQRQYMDAQANHLNELAKSSEFEREETEKMNAIAQQAMGDIGSNKRRVGFSEGDAAEQMDSLAQPLEVLSDAFLRAGIVKQGSKLASDASEIRKREADMQQNKSLDRQRQLENIMKGSQIVASTIGIAQNEDEWRQGLKEVEASGLIEEGLMEQLKQMPFDPKVAAYFRARAISAADQARLDMTAQSMQDTEEYRAATLAQRDRTERRQEAERQDIKNYRERMIKLAGGKSAGTAIPTENELKQTRTLLKHEIFKDVDLDDEVNANELNAAALSITSRAKEKVRENKALTWETALQQAIIESQASGRFETIEGSEGLFGFGKEPKKVKFGNDGKSAETAIPIPSKKTEMKKGKYYITSQGRALWNGTEFEMAE